MTPELQELATLDREIHEPARLMIMATLFAGEEADFLYLQRECRLTAVPKLYQNPIQL
jgi:hypothetical protein